ncbi:MAG: hypothetical protein DME86_11945 [Verrucomicrobia bacterium]|nr:MAG: hypothetical protein DME86_11945 [Verrucomicrobiota bacterium]
MDPYAKPGERKVGEHRPRIEHVSPGEARSKNRQERQAEKQQIVAERRAIKKSARRHLHRLLERDLDETGSE